MHMGVDMRVFSGLATQGTEVKKDVGQELEYLFARQLLDALSKEEESSQEGKQGGGHLALLADHLAMEISKTGALGIGAQLTQTVEVM